MCGLCFATQLPLGLSLLTCVILYCLCHTFKDGFELVSLKHMSVHFRIYRSFRRLSTLFKGWPCLYCDRINRLLFTVAADCGHSRNVIDNNAVLCSTHKSGNHVAAKLMFTLTVLMKTYCSASGLPNLFSVAGHFLMRRFIAGHNRFFDVTTSYCDVTSTLIFISFTR